MPSTSAEPQQANRLWLAGPLILFAFVSLTLGIIAQMTLRQSPPRPIFSLFFSSFIQLKVWFVTVAVILAIFQVITATRIYEKIHFPPSTQFWAFVHRWSGRLAIAFTLPVAYHCIFVLGNDFTKANPDPRVLAHSLLGAALYGAFLGKVWIVRGKGFPAWTLPVAGGVLFTILLGLWGTSALWYFSNVGVSF